MSLKSEIIERAIQYSYQERTQGDDCYQQKSYVEALKKYASSLESFVRAMSMVTGDNKYYEAEVEVIYLLELSDIIRRVVRCYMRKGEEKKCFFFLKQLQDIYEVLGENQRCLKEDALEIYENLGSEIGQYFSGELGQTTTALLQKISELSATSSGMKEIEGDDPSCQRLRRAFDEYCSLVIGFLLSRKVEKTRSLKTKSSGGCFIATAAYSTSTHPDLDTFRNFRDQKLLTNPVGQGLVSLYYKIGPSIAKYLKKQPAIKSFVRHQLGHLAQLMRSQGIKN